MSATAGFCSFGVFDSDGDARTGGLGHEVVGREVWMGGEDSEGDGGGVDLLAQLARQEHCLECGGRLGTQVVSLHIRAVFGMESPVPGFGVVDGVADGI